MAAPFSITKLIGVIILAVMMIMIALPMIQQAFTPSAVNVTNATSGNPICSQNTTANTLINVTNQYQNARCLIATLYGYNNSVFTQPGSQFGKVFSITNSTAFGQSSVTNSVNSGQTGFFVNIFQFTGLSFVFSGIGTIIQVMETLGNVTQILFTTLWLWLPPFESIVIIDVIKLITFYVYLRVILLGVGAWMKYDVLSN
jgi:hypothetical protein